MVHSEASGPIFVVTPGRMGSRTIFRSLQGAGLDAMLVHSFGPELDSLARARGKAKLDASKLDRALELERSVRAAHLAGRRLRIVSAIRDPIDRAISSLFREFAPAALDRRCAAEGIAAVAGAMTARFAQVLPRRLAMAQRWYRRSLPYATGQGVPVTSGAADYAIYDTPQAHCLFIPIERFGRLGEALSEFAGQDVPLVQTGASAADNSSATAIRRHLEQHVPLSPLGLRLLYAQPMMRAAYRPEELDRFRRRWGRAGLMAGGVNDLRWLARSLRTTARPLGR